MGGSPSFLGRVRSKVQRLVAPNLLAELTELRARSEAHERELALLNARTSAFDTDAFEETRNLVRSAPAALRAVQRTSGQARAVSAGQSDLVSVIIPTLNRAAMLQLALDSLHFQQHARFEVIVVNGPSTDNTAEVAGGRDGVRVVDCPAANVSMARNLGIEHSAGRLIAFLDDDAIPEFNWLADLVAAVDSDDVAGAGGLVLGHTGMQFQSRFLAVTRLGETRGRTDRPYDDLGFPQSFCVPYLPGGNSLFRRSALEAVGGFDERYQYYHDDSDLSLRLVDHGFELRQIVGGVIHHHFAPSAVRNPQRQLTDVVPIVRSATYFSYRHGRPFATSAKLAETTELVRNHFAVMASDGLAPAAVETIVASSRAASNAGFIAAQSSPLLHDFRSVDSVRTTVPMSTTLLDTPVIVIARSPDDVQRARSLSATRATRVFVASDLDCVELAGSLWIHHLPETTAAALDAELTRVAEWVDDAIVVARQGSELPVEALSPLPTDMSTVDTLTNSLGDGWLAIGTLVRTGTPRTD